MYHDVATYQRKVASTIPMYPKQSSLFHTQGTIPIHPRNLQYNYYVGMLKKEHAQLSIHKLTLRVRVEGHAADQVSILNDVIVMNLKCPIVLYGVALKENIC